MKKKMKAGMRRAAQPEPATPGMRKKLVILGAGFVFLCAALVAAGFVIYHGLAKSDFFQITAIKIEGARRTTKNLILELSGVDIHTNLLALDIDQVRSKIGANEWIESVEVERQWPNQLLIVIKERQPIAMANLEDGLHYLDKHGVAFARVVPPEDMDFPVITGAQLDTWPAAIKNTPLEEAVQFIIYAGRGNAVLPKQSISEVHLTAENDIVLFLVSRPFPIFLGKGEMYTKYNRLARVLYWLYKKNEFTETAYIRMDYTKNKVLVGKTVTG